MPEQDDRFAHLLVLGRVENEEFNRRGGGDPKVRDVERRGHGEAIQNEARASLEAQDLLRYPPELEELRALGVVITIEGSIGFPLKLESLDQQSTHRTEPLPKWLLLSVTSEADGMAEKALVWVSDEYRAAFLQLFEDYLTKEHPTSGKPRNRALIANMARIRATVLRDLWQSAGEPPTSGLQWWEIWLRPTPDAIELAGQFATVAHLRMAPSYLRFDTRHVVWIEARWQDLLLLPFTAVPITELRRPQFADTIEDLGLDEQMELAEDLAGRVVAAPVDAPAVCLLDTGIRRTHTLIEPSLSAGDVHTVVGPPAGDLVGHGTKMGGLALLGPLDSLLLGSGEVTLRHRLESVKLLPDPGKPAHDPTSYGVVTAEAVALPEITVKRPRVYCMPITDTADRPGEPSLWSAAVDALAAGTDIGRSPDGIELLGPPDVDAARLIIISTGNVDQPYEADYRQKCDLSPIEDPAQAWNALAVGAFTRLTDPPSDPTYAGWSALACDGDVSPHSRTGVIAGGLQWPIKPDICLEGGNIVTDGAGDFRHDHPLLSLRTTDMRDDTAVGAVNATSAAAAQAGRLAAIAMATYPSYWPETIRGLLPHGRSGPRR